METYHAPKKKLQAIKRRCHRCYGSGNAPCQICGGSGEVLMGKDIHGKLKFGRCSSCYGTRTRRCSYCNGEGMVWLIPWGATWP